MFCKAFSKSLVIQPNRTLAVCCSDITRMLKTKLQNVDNIEDFFYNSTQYNTVRKQASESDVGSFSPCVACKRSLNGFSTEMDTFNKTRFPDSDNTIQLEYLELTTSNICKQSCVMCGPAFSSTHAKLSNQPHLIDFADSKDIEKILDILPTVKYINIKGGEPFADHNNLKILKRLVDSKNIEQITIISNGNNISNAFKEVMMKFPPNTFQLSFSIDSFDEVYKWQRGTDYNKTVNTINKFYEDTKINYEIQSTITVYTLPTLLESYKKHITSFKGLRKINSTNVVWDPAWLSPSLFDEEYLYHITKEIMEYDDYFSEWVRNGLNNIKSYDDNTQYERFINHTEKWNKIRGMNIWDLVPELQRIKDDRDVW